MPRASATAADRSAEQAPVDLDGVLADNAARLNSILSRWRSEDKDRPLPLPLVRPDAAHIGAGQEAVSLNSAPAGPSSAAEAKIKIESATGIASEAPQEVPEADLPTAASPPCPKDEKRASDAPAPPGSIDPKSTPQPAQLTASPLTGAVAPPAPASAPQRPASTKTGTQKSAAAPKAAPSPAPAATVSPAPAPSVAPLRNPVAAASALREPASPDKARQGELWQALIASKRAIKAVGWFSCVINVLMLTGPLFMLQVYDRVMTSGSLPTLLSLLGLTVALYGIIGIFELVRSRIITRIGVEIDQRIGDRIFEASLKKSIANTGSPLAALRELDTVRTFAAGPAPMTFFDVWWTPVYLLVIFLTHWTLGIAATIGAAILLYLAYLSDMRSRSGLLEGQKASIKSVEIAETGQRNAEAITAMGMIGAYRTRWQLINQEALAWQMYASDRLGTMSAISKTMRLLQQSIMLAIGAWLALKGEISSGAIIAATIIFGRALAPIEQVVTHWRGSLKAYESYKKLAELLTQVPATAHKTAMPAPKGHLVVEALRVAAPESRQLILSNINFDVAPGQMLAVVGPSASGKSTLVRTLVGVWPPFSGAIKLDGTAISQWDSEHLGQHVGYLPQDTELFSGTVRDNIARFKTDATDKEIIEAATAAHAHDLVMSLPKGYETELGAFGTHLSGGQRQRIALARALFRNPSLVVLDEPNANLDRAGDEALANAIDGMRTRGQAIVLVSHRVQAIHKADTLLYLERGVQKAFGPRHEVMKLLNGQPAAGQKDIPVAGQKNAQAPGPQVRPASPSPAPQPTVSRSAPV